MVVWTLFWVSLKCHSILKRWSDNSQKYRFCYQKIAWKCNFLLTKTIFFENYHLSVSKCRDTLEKIKTTSKLPFPIISWPFFTFYDLLDFTILRKRIFLSVGIAFLHSTEADHLMKSLKYLSDHHENYLSL